MKTRSTPKWLSAISLAWLVLAVIGWLLTVSENVCARELVGMHAQDGCQVRLNDELTAYASVQTAIDASTHPTDVVKISGTCIGVESRGGLTQTAFISKSLTLQGGWKSDFSEWNPDLYPTTLDAQGRGRVIDVNGYISPVIESLRITGGVAYDWTSGDEFGGGLRVISATALITSNHLYGNETSYGGGIYLENSNSILDHNLIFSNTALAGGGIFTWSGHPWLQHNSVVSNISAQGGGLYLSSTQAEVIDNQITANLGRDAGGGVYMMYGAVTISENIILSNTNADSFGLGGGLMLQAGDATLTHNLISNNVGGMGGGIGTGLSNLILDSNTIVSNTALRWGGGLYMNTCTATLTNNVVAENRTELAGSGIFIYASTAQLLHTTIAQNQGGNGIGIQIAHYLSPSYVELTNTILVSHTVGISVTGDSTATLNATLWGAGEWANTSNWQGAHMFLTNNVEGNPKFADALQHDYHLISGSAAIDAGVFAGVTTDLDGHSRLPDYGGLRVDIGAYEAEYQSVVYHAYLPITFKNQ